jgi:hypothetical protein
MKLETAKPVTGDTVNGLLKSEQLACQLNGSNRGRPPPTQGFQIILILRRLTELVVAGLPR